MFLILCGKNFQGVRHKVGLIVAKKQRWYLSQTWSRWLALLQHKRTRTAISDISKIGTGMETLLNWKCQAKADRHHVNQLYRRSLKGLAVHASCLQKQRQDMSYILRFRTRKKLKRALIHWQSAKGKRVEECRTLLSAWHGSTTYNRYYHVVRRPCPSFCDSSLPIILHYIGY